MQWNGAFRFEFNETSIEAGTTRSEFSNGGKAIVEQASEEKTKSKRAGLWESQLGIQVEKLIIWGRPFEIYNKDYNRVHQVYQFHHNTWATP